MLCSKHCPYGFAHSADGCELCACRNPCEVSPFIEWTMLLTYTLPKSFTISKMEIYVSVEDMTELKLKLLILFCFLFQLFRNIFVMMTRRVNLQVT